MSIFEAGQKIILENFYVKITVSEEDASVLSIIDKTKNAEIKSENTKFFYFIDTDRETKIAPTAMFLVGNILTVRTPAGNFFVEVSECDNYFTFEVTSPLPTTAYKLVLAHAKYEYDYTDKNNVGACGISLSYPANPCFYPDCKDKETKAEILCQADNTRGKYALIVAPINKIKGIIKSACVTIDKENGFYTRIGGAWGQDAEINTQNSFIEENSDMDYLRNNMDFYKKLNVDQIDFHKAFDNFCQGDFTYVHYKDGTDFKNNVVKFLEENGIIAGLHTYSHYIDYDSEIIMSVPKWQNQIGVLGKYTLSEDIDENSMFLPTEESTANISDNFTFFSRNTEFILIGDEIMEFNNAPDGFKIKRRACCGTKPAKHRKGEQISHLDGYYQGFCPIIGSELFYHIAHETAKAYNEGGYSSIYLDALDGIYKHIEDKSEAQYYMAAFVCELLKYCEKEPLLEYSTFCPILWNARGRIGAYDTCSRGYKTWNLEHAENNAMHIDRYSAPTMGWYDFYPVDKESKNTLTKYEHTEDVDLIGTITLANNFSIVYNDLKYETYQNTPALRKNLSVFTKYDSLRKAKYFSDSVLEQVRKGNYEYKLIESKNNKFELIERKYCSKKYFDISDTKRTRESYSNPFKSQIPFVRLEGMMSAEHKDSVVLVKKSDMKKLGKEKIEKSFANPVDITNARAFTVTVKGNGKKGGAVAITMKCASHRGLLRYYIDTDFEGSRKFLLVETDNGDRLDLPFDNKSLNPNRPELYYIGRDPFHYHSLNHISIETCGDTENVELSELKACSCVEEKISKPAITVGENILTFDCELASGEYIEYDGKNAFLYDYLGNETKVSFDGKIKAPKGDFEAKISSETKTKNVLNIKLTFGFSGKTL